jgi:hypothetical protein
MLRDGAELHAVRTTAEEPIRTHEERSVRVLAHIPAVSALGCAIAIIGLDGTTPKIGEAFTAHSTCAAARQYDVTWFQNDQ